MTGPQPDRATALGLAAIVKERRERELSITWDDLFFEESLARKLNAESADNLPPLATAILLDTLTVSEKAFLGVLAPEHRPTSFEFCELQSHFEKLGKRLWT